MLKVDIRRLSINDTKELNHFFRLVITDTFIKEGIGEKSEDIEEEINTKINHLIRDIESDGEDHYFLIAEHQGTIIGSIEIGPANKIIRNNINNEIIDLIELGTVFVHPDYQEKGIGNLLLKTMYSSMRLKGIKEFVLDSGYKKAQSIWRKKFGEPNYLLKDYWDKGYDHMIWKIKTDDISK
ncbi:GNAT family acetyltransferase [Bacillus sp. FJAT-18019]|nr:GNAT family acetyltransferase [Bacillus sp. FJAT-18019]